MKQQAQYELEPVFGCLLYVGPRDRDGYGRIGTRQAHIVAWEQANGPVPDGMEVDHGCRRRACCALYHLELVTRNENERRKSWKYRAKRKTCSNGHDLTAHRAVTPEGGVVCRVCWHEARDGFVRPPDDRGDDPR